jgi:hypothetical protein
MHFWSEGAAGIAWPQADEPRSSAASKQPIRLAMGPPWLPLGYGSDEAGGLLNQAGSDPVFKRPRYGWKSPSAVPNSSEIWGIKGFPRHLRAWPHRPRPEDMPAGAEVTDTLASNLFPETRGGSS